MDFELRREYYKTLNVNAEKGAIVMAGSSLCELFPINEMLMSRGIDIKVYNRGISGDTVSGYAGRADVCIYELSPRKLFINIGTNDLNGKDPDIGALVLRYEAFLREIMLKLPETKIYVLSYYPMNEKKHYSMPEHSDRTNRSINAANDAVRAMSDRLGLTWIDVNGGLRDENGELREEFTYDGMHMFPSGYGSVLDTLLPYFN